MNGMETSLLIVLCDTGPLISILQSDSLELVTALFGPLHTTEGCLAELARHGWAQAVTNAGPDLVCHALTHSETEQARAFARLVAAHPASNDRAPDHHLGEAEVMALAQGSEFTEAVVLIDELAARTVAADAGLTVSGFAGVLLWAVEAGALSAEQVQERLERCRQQGTHYSADFIGRIFKAAQEREK